MRQAFGKTRDETVRRNETKTRHETRSSRLGGNTICNTGRIAGPIHMGDASVGWASRSAERFSAF